MPQWSLCKVSSVFRVYLSVLEKNRKWVYLGIVCSMFRNLLESFGIRSLWRMQNVHLPVRRYRSIWPSPRRLWASIIDVYWQPLERCILETVSSRNSPLKSSAKFASCLRTLLTVLQPGLTVSECRFLCEFQFSACLEICLIQTFFRTFTDWPNGLGERQLPIFLSFHRLLAHEQEVANLRRSKVWASKVCKFK